MNIGNTVEFDGANLRSAGWNEKISGMGVLEEIWDFGEHKIANIRVKDRRYDKRCIFDKLLEDKDLVSVMLVCVNGFVV